MCEPCTPDALLEAVRGLRVAEPDLGFKPLLAKLRAQQPDLGAATKEVREALMALKAESKATKASAARRARPMPKAQQSAQSKGKENAKPNVPRNLTVNKVKIFSFTRAEGPAGAPKLVYNVECIGYDGCYCNRLVYFNASELGNMKVMQGKLDTHLGGKEHKEGEEAQASAFAASLSRQPLEVEEDAPVERRRALVSHRREAPPGSAQAPFSELGSGKRSTCPDIAPRTEASRSFGNSGVLGGGALGALGATPAALLVPASLLTDPNFTLKLPGGNLSLPNAGQDADVDTLKGFMLLAYIGQGTSALLALLFKRGERDELAELDKLIQTASARGQSILS